MRRQDRSQTWRRASRLLVLGMVGFVLLGLPGAYASAAVAPHLTLSSSHGKGHGGSGGGGSGCTGGTTTTTSSTNWAGYAAETCLSSPAKGAVTFVQGTWTQPSVTCGSTNTYSAFWVGIDGYSDGTVEQTGTEADCSGGVATYSAWYEMYPKAPVTLQITISPGDSITASVAYASGSFTLTLKDTTTGQQFTTTILDRHADRTSAEWIAEAPYSGGVLPLADFGVVDFTGCTATLEGVNGPISDSSWQNAQINMVDSSGNLKASTSSLASGGESFSVTWEAST